MSSFTISKQEYIKAAGYIAGIASGSSIGVREFWIYDTIEHKNMDADLYYKRFCQCYEMNAKSVAEQYKDEKPEQDTNDYMKEFKSFYKKGYSLIAQDGETQRQAIANIQKFFHGSLYQVENEKYNFMMAHFYNKILDQLTDMILLNGYESDSWGTFEAPEGRNITRIA